MKPGLRISKKTTFHLLSRPSVVFPLLCPKREYDWVDGWNCQIKFSESGFAEPGCIFSTKLEPEGDAIWMMTDYYPDNFLRILKVCPEFYVLDWTFVLKQAEEGETDLEMTYTMTALSEEGWVHIRDFMEKIYPNLMERLYNSLSYYLRTGEKLLLS